MSPRLSTAVRAVVVASTLATTAGVVVLPAAAHPAQPVDRPVTSVAAGLPAHAAPGPADVVTGASRAAVAAAAVRQGATATALAQLGKPYRWGAAGPSAFDCSGLVHHAFASAGRDLPRSSRAQATAGTPVARSELRPGDLVFFYRPISHVGIYLGDGQIVHASTSGKPVMISGLDRMPFTQARRV